MIQYIYDFLSVLFDKIKEKEKINSIILFGSFARGNPRKDSDIDIFIDIKKESKSFLNKINKMVEGFYKSREYTLFKSNGIDNKFSIIISQLSKWPDLKNSIESTGITLYGKYHPFLILGKKKAKKYLIISWDNIARNRGAFLNKIYGFKVKNKKYTGLIEKLSGKKLGKSTILIPVEHQKEFLDLLEKYKVNAKILEVYL